MRIVQVLIGMLSASLLALSILAFEPTRFLPSKPAPGHAVWDFFPKTLTEARQAASAIVVGRVTAIQDAAPLGEAFSHPSVGDHRLPNQRITLEVLNTLQGNPGRTITLFHTGSDSIVFEGDPPYRVGETYVLFARPKRDEPGTHLMIAPEGRYQVVDGVLRPVAQEGLADVLRGMSVVELAQALAQDAAAQR